MQRSSRLKAILLIAASLFIGYFPVSASTSEELEERMSEHQVSDAGHLQELLDQAKQSLFTDPARTIMLADDALNLAKQLQDLGSTAIAMRLLGQAQLYSGENIASFDHLQQAIAAAEQTSDTHLMSIANRAMGVFYALSLDYDTAIVYYLQAKQLASYPGQERDLALVFTNIGNVLNTQGNHKEAASYFRRAIDLLEQLHDIPMRDNALVGLGVSSLGIGQLAEARRVFEDVLSRARDHNWFSFAEATVYLASVHRIEGEYDVALALYQSIINAPQSTDYLTGLALAYIGLGDTFEAQGRLEEAREAFHTGLELVQGKTMLETEMVLFEHAARLEYQLGDFEAAAKVQAAYIERRNQAHPLIEKGLVGQLEKLLEMELEQSELRNLALEAERGKLLQALTVMGLVLAALACIAFFLLARLRQRALVQIQASNRILKQVSEADALTGVGNRRHLLRRLEEVRGMQVGLTFFLVDLDHFKQVNDTLGHEVGDKVLVAFAEIIQTLCRNDEIVARIGGEEFALIIADMGNDAANQFAERMRKGAKSIDIPELREAKLALTVSIGIAHAAPGTADFSSMYRRADQAMYQAKSRGRNQVVISVA
jgi:diguanylate cyclase (GGDEF)-like protein